jgi:hypothetical protein
MSPQLESALIESLDLLEQGTPIVKILARYPDLAEELRPYLITAVDLTQLAKPPTGAAQQSSKDSFLQRAAALQDERRTPESASTWLRRVLATGLAALLFLFVGSTILAFASAEAIPGDTLYGAKLYMEQMQLTYSTNPETAATMIERFHRERVDEVAALLSLNRHELVTFSGTVEETTPDKWIVEGIPVAITPATLVPDLVEPGFLVQISGTTGNGVVVADRVEVVRGRQPEPDLNTPAPPVNPAPSPTPAPPVKTSERPGLSQPDDGAETDPPAPALTVTPDDDSYKTPEGEDAAPGEDSDQEQNEDTGQQDDNSNQPEQEEGSESSSGDGGGEDEVKDSDHQEQEEENKDSSGEKEEESKDSSEEQEKVEDNKDNSGDTGDDKSDDNNSDGNSGKGSSNDTNDESKED